MTDPVHPASELHRIVGQRLRDARERRGWTREELGEALAEITAESYATITLRRWEIGERNVNISDLWALTKLFGFGLDYWLCPLDPSTHFGDEPATEALFKMVAPTRREGHAAWVEAEMPPELVSERFGDPEHAKKMSDLEARARGEATEVPTGAVEVEIRVIDGKTYLVPKGGN
jgi:transcriptional regulator with XRE-family HTH domain